MASAADLGPEMWEVAGEIFPIFRSLTGAGVRDTLTRLAAFAPIEQYEVPTGTPILDWTVPKEWVVRAAWLSDPNGRTIADIADNNLHLLGYSVPFSGRLTLDELRPHLHTLPDRPNLIPYRTAYYAETWGFCLADTVASALEPGDYEVHIDTELIDGSLTYGELVLPGERPGEVLITTHICHPSTANDNVSGMVVLAALGRLLGESERTRERPTYRLLFLPSTVGSIAWLATHRDVVAHVQNVVVLTGLGDAGPFTYKRSRYGNTSTDRAVEHVLKHRDPDHTVMDFYPYGYDERQFGSLGFDLPVGRLTRGVHGEYAEYHTSADNMSFLHERQLVDSLETLLDIVDVFNGNATYTNLEPYGEPRLGIRGLYSNVGGAIDRRSYEMNLLWILSLADGRTSLLDIAERAGRPFGELRAAADKLMAAGLLA